ncbi:MAG: hypothetical protein HY332_16350 [Chloroflexi bacterium]|nr:hypothetical protein [Chloroflexota bacterium]
MASVVALVVATCRGVRATLFALAVGLFLAAGQWDAVAASRFVRHAMGLPIPPMEGVPTEERDVEALPSQA